jgi:membrane protease YdiL (CAAX protease family)
MAIVLERKATLRLFFAVLAGLSIVFLVTANGYIKRFSIPLAAAAGIYLCFLTLLASLVAPAFEGSRRVLGQFLAGRLGPFICCAILVLPYLIYAASTGDFRWLAVGKMVAIVAPVLLLYAAFPVREPDKFNWQDGLIAVWLVSVVLLRFYAGIWNRPTNLDFMARIHVASLGALTWTYIRPVPDLGYRVDLRWKALAAILRNFLFFALIAIPLGFVLRFIAWNPQWRGFADFALVYLEIFLFIAILEELFFRGFLQNLFGRSLNSWWKGQLVASILFGLFHILHAPFPNWRYVILASIAGWFYGSAYRSSGTLFASVTVHALVDTTWRTFLTKIV